MSVRCSARWSEKEGRDDEARRYEAREDVQSEVVHPDGESRPQVGDTVNAMRIQEEVVQPFAKEFGSNLIQVDVAGAKYGVRR